MLTLLFVSFLDWLPGGIKTLMEGGSLTVLQSFKLRTRRDLQATTYIKTSKISCKANGDTVTRGLIPLLLDPW